MKIHLLISLLQLEKVQNNTDKLYLCFLAFKLVLGDYGKHSGYVVNPMAIIVHHIPFTASLPYHLEAITCLRIEKLTKDRYVPTLLLHKIYSN